MSRFGLLPALVTAIVAICAAGSKRSKLCWLVFLLVCVFSYLFGLWPTRVSAHGRQVLIRSWFTEKVSLQQGGFWLSFPDYVVSDRTHFGPWSMRNELPMPYQVIEVDVPEALVPVDGGVYTFKVNTKVVGRVKDYSTKDLLENVVPIEKRMHDVITTVLREAVCDKPVEEALVEIQRILAQNQDKIAVLLATPAFEPSRFMIDANEHITPADAVTKRAVELVAERKEQSARRAVQEEAHITAMRDMQNKLALKAEEQKLHQLELQMRRDDLLLQKEAYGSEGAAQIEVSRNAKASYIFSGKSDHNTWTTLPIG